MAGSMWEGLLASGSAAAIISGVVTLINRSRNEGKRKELTYSKVASDYELWDEHAQGSAWFGNDYMTRERFDKLTLEEKVEILTDRYGPEE